MLSFGLCDQINQVPKWVFMSELSTEEDPVEEWNMLANKLLHNILKPGGCNCIKWINYKYKTRNVINWIMKSISLGPKVILLSGFHCNRKENLIAMVNRKKKLFHFEAVNWTDSISFRFLHKVARCKSWLSSHPTQILLQIAGQSERKKTY
jgi:hypothetical protein